jgi:hypothetical protein
LAEVQPVGKLTVHTFAPLGTFSPTRNAACEAYLADQPPPEQVALCDGYHVSVTNAGAASIEGPIVVRDQLPSGLAVGSLSGLLFTRKLLPQGFGEEATEYLVPEQQCEKEAVGEAVAVKCTFPQALPPDGEIELVLPVTTGAAQTGALNLATATGTALSPSEAPPSASATEPLALGADPPSFGPDALVSQITGADGAADSQAGGHPYEMVTRFDLKSAIRNSPEGQSKVTSAQAPKDVVIDLPPGLVGSALATPKCTFHELASLSQCPRDTQLGRLYTEPEAAVSVNSPIFNVVPEHGVAAELGIFDAIHNTHAIYITLAPTPAGYVLRASSRELPETQFTDIIATLFGNPAARDGQGDTPVAMFTNPSDCSGRPLQSTIYMDSWEHPGALNSDGSPDLEGPGWVKAISDPQESPPVSGCNLLRFAPESFTFKPDTATANSPTGATFDLKVPQTEAPGALATPPLRDASVTLPPGLTVNPAAGNDLQSCSEAQIGYRDFNAQTEVQEFTAESPTCPDASKIGEVEVRTPALEGTLHGSLYLAAQNENPFHSLLAGYVVIDDSNTGVVVKIPGELKTDPTTGRITGVFDNNPQLPFSDLKIRFFGGPRGDLATPEACGTYTTTSDFEPWSAPDSGPDATPSDSFQITDGCVSGFAPALSAGTLSPQAGAYSPFTLTMSRNDDEQGFTGLTVSLPQGLLGKIAGVAECSDAAIAAAAAQSGAAEQSNPSCPASSQLGTAQTAAGPGPDPFVVGGKAYLTGPYRGAPYGIAVIVPALAGPFDLGTVVVRQALYIDRNDAHVTDVSDPFPTILQGIPLRIKRISVTLDRPSFTFNPTSCEPKTISATATSIGGAHAALASHFQAVNCANLPFKPMLTSSTKGNASKKNGAALVVKVTSSPGQANIAKTRLVLPKALPSRLTTIQKACVDSVFEANPATCPEGSNVGMATVHTPILNGPLSGPAYLVSHGAAAFPDVEFVLQGEGITLILDGQTDIKKGITTSTFNSVPDAPITSFEANLPEGPHSALTSNVAQSKNFSLCGAKLVMPTTITGQNGAVIQQSTKIPVQGCGTAPLTRGQQLKKALRACSKMKRKKKRIPCEKRARRRYGPHKKTKKARHGG